MKVEFYDYTCIGMPGHFTFKSETYERLRHDGSPSIRRCGAVPGRGPILAVEVEGGDVYVTRRGWFRVKRWVATHDGWRRV